MNSETIYTNLTSKMVSGICYLLNKNLLNKLLKNHKNVKKYSRIFYFLEVWKNNISKHGMKPRNHDNTKKIEQFDQTFNISVLQN